MAVILLLGALAGLTLGCYMILCRVAPYGRCRRCHGLGRERTRGGRTRRNCPRCGGTGKALRVGVRLLDRLRR